VVLIPATTGEPKERAISQVPRESESKEEDEPLPEDKLPPTEPPKTSSKIEEEQHSARIEDVPIIHQSPQVAPTESMPQTLTNSFASPPPPPPPIIPEPEICNDSIDNDGDTLIDLSDLDCNLIQTQQQQPPALQQQPAMVSSPEICDDDLDNDLDSKVDSRDEECGSITSGTSSLSSPGEAQSVAGEQTEENKDDDKEQHPGGDLSEDAVEKEESDRGDNNDENSNEEENEDEDDDDEE
jgi:hypothetical protein